MIDTDQPRLRGADRDLAVAAVRALLDAIGEDVSRPGLERTPERVADQYIALFANLGVDPATALGVAIALPDDEARDEVVGITGVPFRSVCEHHLLPFEGVVDVYYAPRRFIAGLSRVAALVRTASQRPNLQERLGQQIAATMMTVLEPSGVAVRIEARHGCIAHAEPLAASAGVITVTTMGSLPAAAWLTPPARAGQPGPAHGVGSL